MNQTSTLEDLSQTLKNLGGKEGVTIEVKIDKESLFKLGGMMVLVGLGTVTLNHFLKNI